MKIRLSSRQSVLAQTQAYQVGEELKEKHPGLEVEYLFRESLGDKNLTDPLWKMPEKGVFTEDFYLDLKENRTDLVVHSWKDLPTEGKPDTEIFATLKRADQRDLLLFKKSSRNRKSIRIFSSSPRRAHNLKIFLSWALPWENQSLEFVSVRGNIPTRVRKLLEDPEIDGLILAKAAMDRLLVDQKFPETIEFLRSALEKCDWMVLPLSENPNAAAQGALAIEIAKENQKIKELLKPIHCAQSYRSAQRERDILKEFGGGCHLALGMSVLERPYGRIEIVKGITPLGELIHQKKFYPSKPHPKNLKMQRLEFESERVSQAVRIEGVNALFVSKSEAWVLPEKSNTVIWTAGLQTWRKLSQMGVWVHGSSEGLGEDEEQQIEILAGSPLKWGRISHDQAPHSLDKTQFGTYHLNLKLRSQDLGDADGIVWKSGSEFLLALQKFPELQNKIHICGPGRTYEVIKNKLGSEDKIFVELSDEFVTVI